MAGIDDFVKKQKSGATFVVSAQMLRMKPQDFHALAQAWFDEGGPGFNVVGLPHRTVIDGVFLISRVTVIKTVSAAADVNSLADNNQGGGASAPRPGYRGKKR